MEPSYFFIFLLVVLSAIWYGRVIGSRVPGLWRTSSQFNSTDDWTPIPQEGQDRVPTGVPLNGWFRGVITPHLEPGEALEGFANGFFMPPRPRDWGLRMGLNKHPLLIAVTPHRMLLFEFGTWTVQRSCFIRYDALQFLQPPQPGFMGTSGRLRFGLRSGAEYQMDFVGPLFNDDLMRQEQQLAAYLRWMAPRLASAQTDRAAA